MGIKTVAVHSEVDSDALHVKMADENICIGPAPTRESYLRMDRILDAVRQTGAQAVHPGYGFLSENAEFVRSLTEAGVVFIGPNTKAMTDMGDKIHSKRIAKKAGVSMMPGFDGEIPDEATCLRVAHDIGYPIMIKASAGGGGKGIRVAWNDKEAREGFRLSKQEAASSFGDDRMLVEKYIDNPHHIEIQLLCDKHGNGIYLNERECSIQRRNQKVIEEAPSSFVDPELRRRLGEEAVQLALAVGYDSAGTVEFLVDSQKKHYFNEMNTRLQVEHPITEEITNIDLVQQMIRIAYGHPLNIKQNDVHINGWSFESRVYAEDPYRGFGIPSIGRLTKYEEPSHIQGIRCDSGIREGSEISIYYDPMICKLISYGKNRPEALNRMEDALDNYVTNNLSLLRDIFGEENFRAGNITTKYLYKTYPEGFKGASLSDEEKIAVIGIASALKAYKELTNFIKLKSPKSSFGEKITKDFHFITYFEHEDPSSPKKPYTVEIKKISPHNNTITFNVNGNKLEIEGELKFSSVLHLIVNNKPMSIQPISKSVDEISISYKGSWFKLKVLPDACHDLLKYMKERPKIDTSKVVLAPMPGAIKNVSVKVGDTVGEGQEVVIIEAMKMQNSLIAPRLGKVKAINCHVGSTVDKNDVLVEFE
uniref:Propionyl-CoA carboxylase alpha chain, mitochondrial n=1 Tax=Acrobeloides nanus TaxID=290746 RepID=A0A914DNJ4_9BILA